MTSISPLGVQTGIAVFSMFAAAVRDMSVACQAGLIDSIPAYQSCAPAGEDGTKSAFGTTTYVLNLDGAWVNSLSWSSTGSVLAVACHDGGIRLIQFSGEGKLCNT